MNLNPKRGHPESESEGGQSDEQPFQEYKAKTLSPRKKDQA